MMATKPENPLLASPTSTHSTELQHVATKRPSLSPIKRKLSDLDEELDSRSPTATSEVPATTTDNTNDQVISPKKKVKTEQDQSSTDADANAKPNKEDDASETETTNSSKWESRLALDTEEAGSDAACQKVLAAYAPVPLAEAPADPLSASELEILQFFLA